LEHCLRADIAETAEARGTLTFIKYHPKAVKKKSIIDSVEGVEKKVLRKSE